MPRLHISVTVLTLAPRPSNNDTHGPVHGHTLAGSLSREVTIFFIKTRSQKKKEEKTWKSGNNEFHRVVKLTSQALQGKSPNNSPEVSLTGSNRDGLDVPGDHACLQEHEIRFVVAVETQGLTVAQAGVNSCSCLSLA